MKCEKSVKDDKQERREGRGGEIRRDKDGKMSGKKDRTGRKKERKEENSGRRIVVEEEVLKKSGTKSRDGENKKGG